MSPDLDVSVDFNLDAEVRKFARDTGHTVPEARRILQAFAVNNWNRDLGSDNGHVLVDMFLQGIIYQQERWAAALVGQRRTMPVPKECEADLPLAVRQSRRGLRLVKTVSG